MNAFFNLRLDEIGARYRDNPERLVSDLGPLGFNHVPPVCHGKMEISSDPWFWRCPTWDCSRKVSVAVESFFACYHKRYETFKAVYLWSMGRSSVQIQEECALSNRVVCKVGKHCRAILSKACMCFFWRLIYNFCRGLGGICLPPLRST